VAIVEQKLGRLTSPTVSPLYRSDWFAVETIISEEIVRDLIPELIRNGAEGIVEYPLNKIV
jgi:ATP phosphoribosyltransferase